MQRSLAFLRCNRHLSLSMIIMLIIIYPYILISPPHDTFSLQATCIFVYIYIQHCCIVILHHHSIMKTMCARLNRKTVQKVVGTPFRQIMSPQPFISILIACCIRCYSIFRHGSVWLLFIARRTFSLLRIGLKLVCVLIRLILFSAIFGHRIQPADTDLK